jgi:hypothetical protein
MRVHAKSSFMNYSNRHTYSCVVPRPHSRIARCQNSSTCVNSAWRMQAERSHCWLRTVPAYVLCWCVRHTHTHLYEYVAGGVFCCTRTRIYTHTHTHTILSLPHSHNGVTRAAHFSPLVCVCTCVCVCVCVTAVDVYRPFCFGIHPTISTPMRRC